jgi:hypothetical protein
MLLLCMRYSTSNHLNPYKVFLYLHTWVSFWYKLLPHLPYWEEQYFTCKFQSMDTTQGISNLLEQVVVGILVVVIDVNPSHWSWTTRLMKVFGHEGKYTCIYNTHRWIVYIMLFSVVCGMSCGSSWLRRN